MSQDISGKSGKGGVAIPSLDGSNALYLEALYERFRAGDKTLGESWQAYFQSLESEGGTGGVTGGPSWQRGDWPPAINGEMTAVLDGNWAEDLPSAGVLAEKVQSRMVGADDAAVRAATLDSVRAIMMIRAYRFRGHLAADLDPLRLEPPASHPELDPTSYGFAPEDFDRPIFIDYVLGLETASINDMLAILRRTYCGTFAIEFMHISDPEEKAWLQERVEGADKEITFTREGKPDDIEGSGDVKYHLGASSDREFDGNKVHLSLTANPSHLEAVDPVVLGKARAKQDQSKTDSRAMADRSTVIPLLLHGDAAFAGQGIVAECFGLSGLVGHKSGGAIHFIVNNQIGFTTNPRFSRSSPYPSDVAKMVEAPIFHVNGDDPEAVVYAAKVATEFRQKFLKPVVIDMFCYRRFGHNEGDEPAFTQPHMYNKIGKHETVATQYARRLVSEGLVSEAEVDAIRADYRATLDAAFEEANGYKPNKADWLDGKWSGLERKHGDAADAIIRGDTGVEADILQKIGAALSHVPEGFNQHRALQRQMKAKRDMF
ncbi:MAG: thiamine pyrophosphate-dependent enzyme, partial [Rhodobiaceae bacterium]